MSKAQYHYVERSSPKGQDFVGFCRLCGKQDLKMSAAMERCENPRGVTDEQALIETINGDDV